MLLKIRRPDDGIMFKSRSNKWAVDKTQCIYVIKMTARKCYKTKYL